MVKLNFPSFEFKMIVKENQDWIFDPIRKKYVRLTPEEWVRQHLISYLLETREVPAGLLGVEKQISVNRLSRRFDVCIFGRNGLPLLLGECKAPSIAITSEVFDQAARYNLVLKANYFIITNGLDIFCCKMDFENKRYLFLDEIPVFSEMTI
ncbi:MAG: type I restriction enzyme HsdR N-terminal domain-containing protein [Bacteroidales bacterium]|nr:type I restriction enzyme HsdR N-terminal domain-containing protein [Bacteroidales bacterium]